MEIAKPVFSSYNSLVDLVAPGENLVYAPGLSNSGTSFASPLVAGAAALLRVEHPHWTAPQVMARLKTTADYVDDFIENQFYRGKLGAGRLNMYRALSDPLKALSIGAYAFDQGVRGGYLYAGQTSQMICYLDNYLEPLNTLHVTLRAYSPYVQLLDSMASYGAVSSEVRVNNFNDPFRIAWRPKRPPIPLPVLS
ncbi:MAG: S8 family serine peptidase [Bacteroidia bacterium]|nr:S8 family serine peptidase [Bacteroidia bacterium]